MENEWEEFDELLKAIHVDYNTDCLDKGSVKIKNWIQKDRILTKIKENHAWCMYFKSEEVNLPDMVKHFAAMNMKLQSLLTRFP